MPSDQDRNQPTVTVVTVVLESRDDNGLQVYSDDLPGLVLSGSDRARVAAAIVPAIEALFRHRGFEKVTVRPTRPIRDLLYARSPRDMDVRVHHEQFVIELPDAA